jgi:phage recombination protein Bet
MSTSTSLATRNGSVAHAAPGALAIDAEQTVWDEYQTAALNQLGLRNAGNGDRAVFLHVSQRTGLDPFARQIYMIERKEKKNEKVNGQWVEHYESKWTIQTGIEGWRVIRDRAERREGVRGKLRRFCYYDTDDVKHKAWTRAEPPAAVEVTYTVRDRNGIKTPYTSVLRFTEYVQTKEINGKKVAIAQWAVKPVHMLEKCTEADVYRKAFPQDYSGVYLDDAMPVPDPDAPQAAEPVQRVTAEQIRARKPQPTTATVVAEDSSPAPAAPAAATAAPAPQQGAGEDPTQAASSSADAGQSPQKSAPSSPTSPAHSASARKAQPGQVGLIQQHFKRLEYSDSAEDRVSRLSATATLAGYDGDLLTTSDLNAIQAAQALRQLERCRDTQSLLDLLQAGIAPEGDAGE